MNGDGFQRYRLRFGDDVASWPAPYRQYALAMGAREEREAVDADQALDRLILDAAMMEADDGALTRQVLGRIRARGQSHPLSFLQQILLRPAALGAATAIVAVIIALGGYQMARVQMAHLHDLSAEAELLALATGAPLLGEARGEDLL
ncbi:hypothetical protein ABLE91_26010 [Aquabacter sp. CN5-332]|uniref:hypothetical protein n=1 Tax=Aquabacter sp. CN5-332 TaxID=3156608 RepID=UPI0032B5BC1C